MSEVFNGKTEDQARKEILDLVSEYCDKYHAKKEYKEGDRISYASRVYDHDEMVNLVDSSLEFWLTSGRYTKEFESKFAEYLGVKFCSLVNSGSSANLLAFMTLTSPLLGDRQVKPGDEMITVAAGFPTTVTPIIQYGAVPVFIDVTIPQYNMDITKLEAALSPKTKVVMAAHTLGNPFDLKAVKEFCEGNYVSSIYLLGSAFEEQWYKESLKYMCQNRRVFLGNNLFSQGAAYGAKEKMLVSEAMSDFVFLGKDKVKSNVGVIACKEGKDTYVPLLEAGMNWYETSKLWNRICNHC